MFVIFLFHIFESEIFRLPFLRLIVKCEKFNFQKILGRLVNGHLETFNRPPAVENVGNIHFFVQIFNKKHSLGARTCRPTILVKTFGTLCFRGGKCNSSRPPPPFLSSVGCYKSNTFYIFCIR